MTMLPYHIVSSSSASRLIIFAMLCLLVATDDNSIIAEAQTTIQFSKPIRLSSQSSFVTVPNNLIFDEINAFEADLMQDLVAAAMAAEKGLTITSFTNDFPTPTLLLTGTSQNTVQVTVSGLKRVALKGRYKSGLLTTLLCLGSVRGEIVIRDLAVTATYNWVTGSVNDIQSSFTDVDADFGCAVLSPLGGLTFGLFGLFFFDNLVDLFVPFGKIVGNALRHGVGSLNGRFENAFSIQDAIAGVEETGSREIRQAAESALMTLGGVESAVACFIANFITDEMIRRLGLQSASQIDQLRRLLSTLPDFIAARLPDDVSFINGNILGTALQNFLTLNLSNIVQPFLLTQLNTAFNFGVDLIRDIEMIAIQALCNIVKIDFGRLIGGVNARLVINRTTNMVVFDGFHSAPTSFIGQAEATNPCNPTYVIPAVDNVAEYIAFNSNQRIIYSSNIPTNDLHPRGLLTATQVRGQSGLYSYIVGATIRLINFQDCGGCTEANFRWPQCPVAGEPLAPIPIPQPVAAPTVVRVPTARLPPGVREP